jgi:beta-N-acetylhexosaminidase
MSELDLQLGQLFLAGFDGMSVDRDHPVIEAVERDGLGGVILFDRNVDGSRQNIDSSSQLRELTGDLQRYAGNTLIIAVDQEGGMVCRLKEADGFPATRSAGRLADADDPEQVRRQADIIAGSLRECGINFNLAPVVDLNLNAANPIIGRYERSYGSSPEVVVAHALQFITAHHDRGIACCIKHFPGHGSAAADSHLGFVDITDCWEDQELEPYSLLMAAGFEDAVMTAHVIHRGLDNDALPATLSRPLITGLLRDKLGFQGVVVSDDLQMKAISDRWGFEEAVQMAVLAGVDLVIVGNNLVREKNIVPRGVGAVAELIKSGRIGERAIRSSLDRIAALKRKIAGDAPWKSSQPTTW